jgi:type VI secretion system protein ImpF
MSSENTRAIDRKIHDRLQPSLFDRLNDMEPFSLEETAQSRVLTKTQLRAAVLRDLSWLFNASASSPKIDAKKFVLVSNSVLNFGLPDLSGQLASTFQAEDLQDSIRQAILTYEPRVLPETIEIEVVIETSLLDSHNCAALLIRGQLWAQPVPLEFLLRSQIDLEEGRVTTLEALK